MNIEGLHVSSVKVGVTHGFAGAGGLAYKLTMVMKVNVLDPFFLVLESTVPEFTRLVRGIVQERGAGGKAVQGGTFQAKFESARLGGKLKHEFVLWGLPEGARDGEGPLLVMPTGAFGKHVIVEAMPAKEGSDDDPAVSVKFDVICAASLLSGFDGPAADELDGSEVFLDTVEQEPDISERPETKPVRRTASGGDDGDDGEGDDREGDDGEGEAEGGEGEAEGGGGDGEPTASTGGLDGWSEAVRRSRAMPDFNQPRSAESILGIPEGSLAGPEALRDYLKGLDVKGEGGLRDLYQRINGKQTRAPKEVVVNDLAASLRPRLSTGAPDGWPASMPWRCWTAAAVDDYLRGLGEDEQRRIFGELTTPDAAARAPRGQIAVALLAAFSSRFATYFVAAK